MRTYSIFTPHRWIGTTGKRLRFGIKSRRPGDPERERYKDAQIVADVLVNNPNANQYGLYYVTAAMLSEFTGLTTEEVEGALAILGEERFAYYDPTTELVWVKEMARVQMFLPLKVGNNNIKSANAWYAQLPPNPFLGPFFDRYAADLFLDSARQGNGRLPLETAAPLLPPAEPSLVPQWFRIFLEAYPASRRVGGYAGESAFARAMAGQDEAHLNVMLDALWFQRKSTQWREGVIPSMVKWLDEEHWTRDLTTKGGAKFKCPDDHPNCTSAGAHALRAALELQCWHEPRCESFLEHYSRERESGDEARVVG